MKKDLTKYFHIEKIKDPFFVDAFNNDVIKVTKEGRLELLTGPQENLKSFELIKVDEKYIVGTDYSIREIPMKEVQQIIKEGNKNYSLWQNHMSSSDNMASPNLSGPSGGRLA
ncbi:hypothetical protein HOD29_03755 [archaeon]|jgi:hypothetical protein|nr:hypothetical protein [archaeon]